MCGCPIQETGMLPPCAVDVVSPYLEKQLGGPTAKEAHSSDSQFGGCRVVARGKVKHTLNKPSLKACVSVVVLKLR